MESCIFCKIINKEIPTNKLEHEDNLCMAFHDINPRAKIHLLIIPKKHISSMKEVEISDEIILGRMLTVASNLAKKHKLDDYKLLMSTGKKAGQEVFHIHLHLMSAPA
jgi:histidine triad (HIT) family protein